MAHLYSLDSSSPSRPRVASVPAIPASDPQLFLGGYWLLGQVAQGEACTIHRARSIVAAGERSQVAIKRLRAGQQDGSARARLLREARLGLGLRSPNLVRVLEIHDDPELFVVMEYVEGATVLELFSRTAGRSALRHLLPMFVDALHGLSALHHAPDEQGAPGYLVHQAPSAHHMLVGVDGVTRLIDLSHAHGSALPSLGSKLASGTLAPEQREGRTDLDPRCDIYLIGSALHELLERSSARLDRVGEEAQDAADEASLRAQCAPLRAIAQRASATRRSARFWSADEMAYQLQKVAVEADLYASRPAVGAWLRSVLAPAPAVQGLPRVNPRLLEPAQAPLQPPAHPTRLPEPISSARVPRARPSVPPPPPPTLAPPPAPAFVPAAAFVSGETFATASFPAAHDSFRSATPRKSKFKLPTSAANRLRRAGSVAGAIGLLTGAFALGVRGFNDPPTALASRPPFETSVAAPALGSVQRAEPRPIVTSLAAPPRVRSMSARTVSLAGAPLGREPAPVEPAESSTPTDGELISEAASGSTIDTIAASIRVVTEESHNDLRRKNLFTRPRVLRSELPGNPY